MNTVAFRYARLSQILLLVGALVSVALRPEFFFSLDQGGVSNYGVIPLTIFPYTLAMFGCGYFMMRSAFALPSDAHQLRDAGRIIFVVGLFYIFMLLSTYPYQQSLTLTYLHQIISIMMVLILLLSGVWMHVQLNRSNASSRVDIVILVSGFLLGFLTVVDVLRLLFTAQITIAVGFARIYLHFIKQHHSSYRTDDSAR